MNKSYKYSFLLLLAAMIWGSAFVAQSAGMDYVGPFTFNGIRSFLGFLVLIPVANFVNKKSDTPSGWKDKELIVGGIVCGAFLFLASSAQQIGIQYTTVGKSGFITTFYIVLVPIFALFLNKKPSKLIWVSVAFAVCGLYFLCINESFTIQSADIWLFACAILFTLQILAIDHYAPKVNTVKLSCYQFLVVGLLSVIPMIFEKPELNAVIGCWTSIAYAGILSSGVAYTLQIVAQKNVKPEIASILMSLESVFSVIFGFLILHEKLTSREGIGCILMFIAVILAQVDPKSFIKKADS